MRVITGTQRITHQQDQVLFVYLSQERSRPVLSDISTAGGHLNKRRHAELSWRIKVQFIQSFVFGVIVNNNTVMPFLLQRQWTLPDNKINQKKVNQVSWKAPDKTLSFWSIPQNDKETDEEREDSSQLTTSTLKTMNLLATNLFDEGELDKKIQQNYYSINLTDLHQPFLPKVKSISKAQKLLVSKTEFAYFKKQNSPQGVYHSLVTEIERKEEAYFHKLNISSKAQIKTRKNIFEMHHRHKSGSCSVSFKMDATSNASKKLILLAKPEPQEKKISSRVQPAMKLKSKSCEKWKLKDFLDPIIQSSQTDQQKIQRMQNRELFLRKIKSLQGTCEQMQYENNNTKYLQIFERFNTAVEAKLVKKQRKLDKIKIVFKK